MKKNVAVLSGDGIGPEVTQEAVKILKKIGEVFHHQFVIEEGLIGAIAIDITGSALPEQTLSMCHEADAVLLGAVGHPKYDANPQAPVRPEQGLLRLRKELGLFANIRPITIFSSLKSISPLKPTLLDEVDFVIYRELTGGLYFGEKHYDANTKTAVDTCIYQESEIIRIARLAFQHAMSRKKKVTLVDKANVLETSRLWRKITDAMALDFPEVTYEKLYVDNAAMQLIINPRQFDVILTENMFGDILSDEASVLSGSMGLLPSSSLGEQTALFEPIHGSYPQAAGKNIANPMAAILSVAMMCEHWQLHDEAASIRSAVNKAIDENYTTIDLNKDANPCSTKQVGDFIALSIENSQAGNRTLNNIAVGKMTII